VDHVKTLLDRLTAAIGIGMRKPSGLGRAVDCFQIMAEARSILESLSNHIASRGGISALRQIGMEV